MDRYWLMERPRNNSAGQRSKWRFGLRIQKARRADYRVHLREPVCSRAFVGFDRYCETVHPSSDWRKFRDIAYGDDLKLLPQIFANYKGEKGGIVRGVWIGMRSYSDGADGTEASLYAAVSPRFDALDTELDWVRDRYGYQLVELRSGALTMIKKHAHGQAPI